MLRVLLFVMEKALFFILGPFSNIASDRADPSPVVVPLPILALCAADFLPSRRKGWRYDSTASPSCYADVLPACSLHHQPTSISPGHGTCCRVTSDSRQSRLRCLCRSRRRWQPHPWPPARVASGSDSTRSSLLRIPPADVVEGRGVCPVAGETHDVVWRRRVLPCSSDASQEIAVVGLLTISNGTSARYEVAHVSTGGRLWLHTRCSCATWRCPPFRCSPFPDGCLSENH